MIDDNDRRLDAEVIEPLCKHLDGDLFDCLMLEGKCVGADYCRDYEEEGEKVIK